MKNEKIKLTLEDGRIVDAQAPLIVSASRATDIPAFYSDWFFNRLSKGYVRWRNPYNGKDSYVSFANTKFIVFWSKNPDPLLPLLPILKQKGIGCYIQYTLNDYDAEGLEPGVPSLPGRIETFKRLVDEMGLGSAVWRFDPLILTDRISKEDLLHKINNVANSLRGYVEKLVFSFADISTYRKVGHNLSAAGINYREWTEDEMVDFSRKLADMNLGLELATCAEKVDLLVAVRNQTQPLYRPGADMPIISRISSLYTQYKNRQRPTHTLRLRRLKRHWCLQHLPPWMRILLRQHVPILRPSKLHDAST